MPLRASSSASILCFKCKSASAIIATREGPKKSYCVSCFLDFCRRTVRDTLFRECRLPPEIPIVLCVSGGMNSMAMLHMLGELKQQNLHRGGNGKIVFRFFVLHLEEDGVVVSSPPERVGGQETVFATVADVVRRCATTMMFEGQVLFQQDEVFVKSMRDVLSLRCNDTLLTESPASSILLPLSASRVTPSDAEEVYVALKRLALTRAARQVIEEYNQRCGTSSSEEGRSYPMDCSSLAVVITGENGVGCCIRALGDLVRGNGASMTDHSAFRGNFVGQEFGGALAMRPLRGLLPKEVLFYCKLNGVPFCTTPTPTTLDVFSSRSINRLLEQFIVSLTVAYPSTPFNILNSITKLASAQHEHEAVGGSRKSNEYINDDVQRGGGGGGDGVQKQQKIILSKASQVNLQTMIDLMASVRDRDQCNSSNEQLCIHCSCCGLALPAAEREASLHSVFHESKDAHLSDQRLCYGCRALVGAVGISDGETSSAFLAHAFDNILVVQQPQRRALSKDEVEDSIREFLVPPCDDDDD